jgi:predicted Zn-dependent protease
MTGQAPQAAVERALQAARCDDCVVIAAENSSANLRWAGNTLTTNGVSRTRQLTVIAITRHGDDAAAGVISRAGVRDDQIADVVRAAEQAAAGAVPAQDALPLVPPAAASTGTAGWDEPVTGTGIGVFHALRLRSARRSAPPPRPTGSCTASPNIR